MYLFSPTTVKNVAALAEKPSTYVSTGTLHLNIVSIEAIPLTIVPPPELINILIGGGNIPRVFDKVKLLLSNSPIFLFNSTQRISDQFNSTQFNKTQLNLTQLNSAQLNPIQLNPTQLS